MAYITKDVLDLLLNESTDTTYDVLKDMAIAAAENIVKDYLGYDPALATYNETFFGYGYAEIQLNAKPITELLSVTIDGVSQSVDSFYTRNEMLGLKSGVFPLNSVIAVEYKAGYTTIPGAIQDVALRIAALKMSEVGNVGITGKSSDNGGSKTFISTTNFTKYLNDLSGLRILRL